MKVAGPLTLAGAEVLGVLPDESGSDVFEGRLVKVTGGFLHYFSGGIWEALSPASAGVLPPQAPADANKILISDGTNAQWTADPIAATPGQFLQWDGTLHIWADPPTGIPDMSAKDNWLLSNDGTDPQWVADPSAATPGQFLSWDGSAHVWSDPPASLPAQATHAGKFLQTDGAIASWEAVTRGDLNSGTPDWVVINDGTGAMAAEQFLDQVRGGFGEDVSAYTGFVRATAGDFSASPFVAADLPTMTSAELAGKVSDETGSGALVFADDPLLTDPVVIGDITVFDGTTKELSVGQKIFDVSPTGCIEFDGFTITGATFTVGAGSGQIVDHATQELIDVSWSAFTLVAPLTANGITHVYVTRLGALVTTLTLPDATVRRDNIVLGRAGTVGGTIISTATTTVSAIGVGDTLVDHMEAISAFRVSGIIMSSNGANMLVNRSAGSIFRSGVNFVGSPKNPNIRDITSVSAVTLLYTTSTTFVGNSATAIGANYESAPGVVTAYVGGANQATIQRIYQYPGAGMTTAVQYGPTIYANLSAAIQAIGTETYTPNSSHTDNAVLVAIMCITKGCTALNDPAQARIFVASRFGESSVGAAGVSVSTFQNVYGNSTNPEITTDVTRGAVSFKQGSGSDADIVLEALNGAGSQTWSVSGAGDVTANKLNKVTITAPATGSTLTVADGKTLTASNTLTMTATDGSTAAFGAGGTVAYTANNLSAFAATTSAELLGVISDESGSGLLVFNTSPTLITPRIDDSATFEQISTPSVPASGFNRIYPKSDDKWYSLNSAGVESPLGSGGGDSTFVNYFSNPGFEDTANGVQPTGWTGYDDAAAAPVDGTGGTTTGVTFLASTSSPIRGTSSVVMSKDAVNRQGKGFAYAFTISPADKGYTAGVEFDMLTSVNYAAGDLVFYIYDVTNSVLITPRAVSLPKLDSYGKFFSDYGLTSGTSYRFIFHIATTNASAWTVKFDNMVNTTTRVAVPGAPVGEWQSYSPTLNNLSGFTTVPYGWWKRVGDSMECLVAWAKNGSAGVTASIVSVPLPTGYTADLTKISSQGNVQNLGTASLFGAFVANFEDTANVTYQTTTTVSISRTGTANNALGTAFLANGIVSMRFTIPIAEWAGSGTNMGPGAQVEYLSSTSFTSFTADRSPAGTALPTTTPAGTSEALNAGTTPWQYTQQNSDKLSLEVDIGGTGKFAPCDNSIIDSLRYDGTNYIGLGFYIDASSNLFIIRGKYSTGTTVAWSTIPAGTRYRLTKAKPSSPVGFGLAGTDGSAGLYKPGQAPGLATGAAIAAGYVGETKTWATPPTGTAVTTTEADWTNATISLTPGVWLITANIAASYQTGTSTGNGGNTIVRLTDASNNIIQNNDRQVYAQTSSAATTIVTATIPLSAVVSIATTTQYKLRIYRVDGPGVGSGNVYNSSTARSDFYAVRIA